MQSNRLLALVVLLVCINANTQEIPNFPVLRGPYLGQKPPGMTPEIFAPGIISTDLHEGSSGFNKDCTHFVFQRNVNQQVRTYEIERKNDQWSQPKLVPFADMMRNGDFVFAPDGKTLYFQSNVPIEGLDTEERVSNIWVTKKTGQGWTKSEYLDFNINTKWADSFASATTDGILYFFSRKPGGLGLSDMYKSKLINGKYTVAENLGDNFNTEHHEWDPFIAPDESYMIFCSMKPGGYGSDDFYISFRDKNDNWSIPVNMGDTINSKDSENRPYVTPDGKYFFYTSTRNGNRDVFWVDAKLLETYRTNK
jgi:hypothetical protein